MTDGPELDILVVGGGITGAGIALDAATRGLRVGIVEAQDWAGGTSRWSSKLVHGGLRYLQALDFKLVAEALGERERLLYTLAPHLVKPVPFLYPITHKFWERPYVTAGVGLYDTLAHLGSKVASMPFHRHLGERGVARAFPGIRPGSMVGAVKYWDGKVDDARLVLTLVRTAAGYGALAASRTRVTDFVKNDDGVVTGANVVDLETDTQHTIRAKKVIAATGVWTEETQDLAETDGGLKVLASKGIHIVVPRERIAGDVGLILQTEKSVLFVIPWEHHWIIGTTDTPYEQDLAAPVATGADIDYVIEHANVVLADPLTREDVIGTYAGLRPLLQPGVKDGSEETASTKVSREHTVTEAAPGLITIAGGKLTTYRVMAEDAVDFALGKDTAAEVPSATDRTLLHGADGYVALTRQAERLGAPHGWDKRRVTGLLNRYGSGIAELQELVEQDPSLARPLEGAPQYLRAEIVQAARNEGALHLEDVFETRTRMSYDQPRHGLDALEEVADLLSRELDWDDTRRDQEKEAYRRRCAAEDAAAETYDDAEAAAARAAAPATIDLSGTDHPVPEPTLREDA
ncbi:glycerol-3-phosphate dehydrogenase/oxidase [Kocuria sp. JC486]|uniref:Glycerol-3-phosphate dehydrogenase n=2 Tax=Kocuria soli TaxID=2485125 RepID=A0A3N4AEN4_9MICC|nr:MULTISPECIES: glycerol-3-phosphate dehydrogenase/oxidase [Kocuria]NHU84139.1 glycerol-3-phosphate dehydrogenase/oxidase [Kocuria sp. JC486]ROZ64713.1 glycerol-3-phosphate dehydrogenase/oxidase [Kocuria soli]